MPAPIEEQHLVLQDFTNKLEELDIAYMLTGSVAMMYYITPRMTADIDIVVEIKRDIASQVINKFAGEYYIPESSMRSAIERNTMFNMLHEQTLVKVDCVLKKNNHFQNEAFDRRRKVDFAGFYVWIITAEDLILSKLNWAKSTASEMQLRDVENLLRSPVDLNYIQPWSIKLEVDNTLNLILERLK